MTTTQQNLNIQTDKVLSEPELQTRVQLKDSGATQTLYLDWTEPAGADRTVTFSDPGADDSVAYLDKAQTFQNKKISTAPVDPTDIANKDYVDTAVSGGTPIGTSAPGGGTLGRVTADEDLGLEINAGILEVKVDGVTIQFDGSGNLSTTGAAIADATSAPGGGSKGKVTADEDLGLSIASGVMQIKVDGTSIGFNGSGELTFSAGLSGPTGVISNSIAVTEQISGVSPPANGTTGGGDISTLDFQTGLDQGIRFAIPVPDDYFSGDITLYVTHQMSTADPSASIEIETAAKIVDVAGGVIDSASYPATQTSLTVPVTTDVERRQFLTILAGDFAIGDTIQILYTRLGADVMDTNGANQKVISFQFSYTGTVNGRVANRQIRIFENAAGETPTTPNTISAGDISVEDFPTAIDSGLKFDFTVPDNWDQFSSAELRLSYVMSASAPASVVRLETRAKIARVSGGTIDTIAPASFDFTPGAGAAATPKTTSSIMSIPSSSMSRGDTITIILARRGTDVADTHAGDLQLICANVVFGVVSVASVSAVTIREEYLNQGVFGNPSGPGVNGDTSFPTLGGDFETFDRLSSTAASGALDVSYEGRLGSLTNQVKEIRFFVKGVGATPQWTLNVYAEGTGLVHTDGPNVAGGVATEIVKTDVDLSAQPAGSKRFFVVITADIDAGEELLVSRPFVRME